MAYIMHIYLEKLDNYLCVILTKKKLDLSFIKFNFSSKVAKFTGYFFSSLRPCERFISKVLS
jgi:hypothetical protein